MNPSYIGQPVPVPGKVPAQKNGFSGRIMIIIGVLLVAVIAGVGMMLAGQDKSGPLSQRLTYRLEALDDILQDGKKNASSDKLRKVTGDGSILMAGDMTAIKTALPESKGKKPATIVAAESSKASLERLKTAKINGTYDAAYSSELATKLETTSALASELYNASRSTKLKTALKTTYEHLVQLRKDLAAH